MDTLKPHTNGVAENISQAGLSARVFKWCGVVLIATVWISAGLFGLYIIAFYAASLFGGNIQKWNKILPGLYQKGAVQATAGIGVHFAMGGVILILGSIQLLKSVRIKYPAVHRWIGRIYVVACLLAAAGGLLFIVVKGTIGGIVMDVGFSIYGILMFMAAIETYRHARSGRLDKHRAWALRLYALAIGSWLYRIDYGFWLLFTGGVGHNDLFTGSFDRVMAFFFYIPNLLVTEAYLRSRRRSASPFVNVLSSGIIVVITGFLVLGTYYFTKLVWGPPIVQWLRSW